MDLAVRASKQDDWRNNPFKVKKVMRAIKVALESFPASGGDEFNESSTPYVAGNSGGERADAVLELVKKQHEY